MAGNAVWAYTQEGLRGLWDSLSGFMAVFHLDDQPVIVPRREQPTEVTSRPTVFAVRRASQIARNNPVIRKESRPVAQPKSSKYQLIRCVSINTLMILAIKVFIVGIGVLPPTSFVRHILEVVSILWFGDISKGALNYRRIVYPNEKSKNDSVSISSNIADLVYGIALEFVVLIMSLLSAKLQAGPVAPIASFFITAQLNALYCFDYILMSHGIQTKSRCNRIEGHWPYYIGFGTILTLASTWTGDFIIDGMIFAALFPIFIVSAVMAKPPTGEKRVSVPLFYLSTIVTDKIFGFAVRNVARYLTSGKSIK